MNPTNTEATRSNPCGFVGQVTCYEVANRSAPVGCQIARLRLGFGARIGQIPDVNFVPPRLALILVILMWGCSFVATKAVLSKVSPVTLLFTRFGIGTIALLAMAKVGTGGISLPRETWPPLAIMGFVGVFVHQMLQGFAMQWATAVHTGWLIALIPIWSALFSAMFLREKLGLSKVVGLIGGFCGALLVLGKEELNFASIGQPAFRGDFLILLSTINWAVYSVLGHKTIKRLGSVRATTGAMLFGWLMLAPLFIWRRAWREWPMLSASSWGWLLFLGLGCSALGYLFWYRALEKIEVSRVASFLYAQPLVTMAAAFLLLGEKVSASTILGGLAVLASVYVVQRAPR